MDDIGRRQDLRKQVIEGNGRIRDNSPPAALPTVLLVGLTVLIFILAAIFFIGISSSQTTSKMVGISAGPTDYGAVLITVTGGDSVNDLMLLEVTDQYSNGRYKSVGFSDGRIPNNYVVGNTYIALDVAVPPHNVNTAYYTRISVKGVFRDGTQVILLDQPVTFMPPLISSDKNQEVPIPTVTYTAQPTHTPGEVATPTPTPTSTGPYLTHIPTIVPKI